jgi:uncharacterized protein (DUF2384 family)
MDHHEIACSRAGDERLEIMSGRYADVPQDVRDRVGYIVGISVGLGAVFDEAVQAELDWLHRPHPKLANRAPISVMLMGHMAQLITVADLVAEERGLVAEERGLR